MYQQKYLKLLAITGRGNNWNKTAAWQQHNTSGVLKSRVLPLKNTGDSQ